MFFDFGENLKALRKEKGLTQEQAAELLSVSKQSVSRWENNSTYPDIMFLPVLASFYGVTVDRLLGSDHDRNRKQIEEFETRRQEAHNRGNHADAFELSYQLYATFPNHRAVMDHLMVDSYLMGLRNGERKRYYLELSVSVAERYLKMTEDMEERCRCIGNISVCRKLLGDEKEAARWLMELPSIWSCIDAVAPEILEGQDRIDSIRSFLDGVLQLLYKALHLYASECRLNEEAQLRILEKFPKILETFFEEGDYGYYHVLLSRNYLELAKCRGCDALQVEEYAAKALEHARLYDALAPGEHRSVLFTGHSISPADHTRAESMTQTESVKKALAEQNEAASEG